MKKKIVVFIVVLFVVLGLGSCGNKNENISNKDSISDVKKEDTSLPQEDLEISDEDEIIEDIEDVEDIVVSTAIRPEIKEAIDSYEAFFNEYVTFMNEFSNSEDTFSMMNEYAKFMKQYAETMSKMEAMENEDLNDAEAIYLLEATNRINAKLLEIQ